MFLIWNQIYTSHFSFQTLDISLFSDLAKLNFSHESSSNYAAIAISEMVNIQDTRKIEYESYLLDRQICVFLVCC